VGANGEVGYSMGIIQPPADIAGGADVSKHPPAYRIPPLIVCFEAVRWHSSFETEVHSK